MSLVPETPPAALPRKRSRPFRAAVFRGLGGFIPPLLTVVVFFWIFGPVKEWLLDPFERGTQWVIGKLHEQYVLKPDEATSGTATIAGTAYPVSGDTLLVNGHTYIRVGDGRFVPNGLFQVVKEHKGDQVRTWYAADICREYADIAYMKWYYVLPAFLALFTLFLYLLGKALAGRLGQFVWGHIERLISRVPLVRNVYSSVKQVTEFLFNQRELEFTRVVAVEYPRKDCWSLAFVTGESLLDVTEAAGEPALSVLIPTSPMPITGFTCIVLKRDVIDLNITIDQALEYIISCGVVVPPHQLQLALRQKNESQRAKKASARLAEQLKESQSSRASAAAAADGRSDLGSAPAAATDGQPDSESAAKKIV